MIADTDYVVSHTLAEFHKNRSFVRGIKGPLGSGKSVGMCWEIIWKSCTQEPFDNVRYSRWVIIRNSYRELMDTTLKTWFDWFPEELGVFLKVQMTHTIILDLPDGTVLNLEVLFRALDKPQDVKKLLSLELTGGWVNEAKEIPKSIVDMLQGRVGRYPSKKKGGPSWHGVIMDTNPPDSDHWWYKTFEDDLPSNWQGFNQPSGMSDKAENIDNLPPLYYDNIMPGKNQEWINVFVHGQYGFVSDGKPVYPEYNDDTHHTDDASLGYVFDRDLDHKRFLPPTIYIGIDFGLTPAAVFGVLTPSGQMQLFDELVTEDMGAVNFGKLLYQKISNSYPLHAADPSLLEIYADPAGEQRSQSDETTPFQMLDKQKISAYPTYTNDPIIRREVVADYLGRLDFNGKPAFLVGPNAPMTRKSFAGGYKYKRLLVSGESRFKDVPDKGRYSHIGDACQYLFLGAVGGDRVMGGYGDKPIDYSVMNNGIV